VLANHGNHMDQAMKYWKKLMRALQPKPAKSSEQAQYEKVEKHLKTMEEWVEMYKRL